VLAVNRYWPFALIVTQHGAVCRLATGGPVIEVSSPMLLSSNAETVPRPAPLWALVTNSCSALVA